MHGVRLACRCSLCNTPFLARLQGRVEAAADLDLNQWGKLACGNIELQREAVAPLQLQKPDETVSNQNWRSMR